MRAERTRAPPVRGKQDLVLAHRGDVADWDAPFAHEALARALAAAGAADEARRHRRRAVELTARVAGPQDHEVLETALARGPWHGLDAR